MLRFTSRLFNLPLFNVFSLCFLLISLQSCKSGQAVVAETDKKIAEPETFTEKIPATDISFDMVLIPEGTFEMGSPENQVNRKADEGPMKTVELDAFYMGKYELGWEVFELFFKQNKNLFESLEADKLNGIDAITRPSPPYEDPSYGMGKVGYPAISMSAYSALVFCKWLSTVTGRFYRLPTEAEWEYAVYYKNSDNHYAKVGSKLPNPWGLYDMHGNVSEWTLDEYKENALAITEPKNPWVKPTVIHPRVIKGGSWDDDAKTLRSSARIASSLKLQKRDPQIPKSFWWNTDSNFIGFRLVSPKVQPSKEEQKQFWQIVLDE